MTRRISGQSFDIELLGTMVHVEKASLTITDSSAVAQTRGIPDGYVDGEVSAECEFELDAKNFKLLSDAAKRSG
ncbi:phage protein, partial [Aeromonas enteropelogenes]|uniref:phage protein n=1 Tax=Aeromonas enteropelogenes TaxID=29489 RepID=UPI003B9E9AE2